ncbi:MAG TPA: SDR family oxidoreductase [Usitatibacter sp.]|nr:SDR family oxidoreductase [Usitatibacter sp.]
MSRLSGKAAFVTGAARGIGRGIALALAREGATVAMADVDAAALQATSREAGARAFPVACDVSNRAAVFDAMARFVAQAGGLDIVVNNAVHFHYAPLPQMPEQAIGRMIDVGLKGLFWVTQAATPHLVARGGGCIVNLSSAAVFMGIRNAAVYTSIKGAIDAFTRQQAVELGPSRIRVNAIAPGPVETPGASSVIDASGWEARRARTPIGRLATTEDIGAAVVYLASDDARSVTGITLKIDGGITVVGP